MISRTRAMPTASLRMPRARKGLSLLEVALGIGLTALVSIGVMQITNDQSAAGKAASAASMMTQVQSAAQDYMKAHYAQLITAVPVGGNPIAIRAGRPSATAAVPPGPNANLMSIQGAGFLPPTFVDRDNYRFRHVLLVRQPVAGTLDGLVVQASDAELGLGGDTGTPIRDTDLGRMVSRMGNVGGARFTTNPIAGNATVVQGNGGSWASNVADWATSGFTPQTGRAAATASFGNASMLSDYLNRYDIGIPEANTMRAGLIMGGNSITGASSVTASGPVTSGGSAAANSTTMPGLSMYMANGGIACAGGTAGCKFWIDDNSGFASNADGWVRYQGNVAGTGLSIEGVGNNLYVGGNSYLVGDSTVQGSLTTGGHVYGTAGVYSGADINADVNVNAGQNVNAAQNVTAGANVTAAQDIGASRDVYANRNLNVGQDMYAGRNMVVAGDGWVQGYLTAGNLNVQGNAAVNGNFNVGGNVGFNQNLNVGGVATVGNEIRLASTGSYGAACSTNGAITADGSGKLLNCIAGRWGNSASFTTTVYNMPVGSLGPGNTRGNEIDIGRHSYCGLTQVISNLYVEQTTNYGDGTFQWAMWQEPGADSSGGGDLTGGGLGAFVTNGGTVGCVN